MPIQDHDEYKYEENSYKEQVAKEKKTIFFVSYAHEKGFGNIELTAVGNINSTKDLTYKVIQQMTDEIKRINGFDEVKRLDGFRESVTILNIIEISK